jgi:hypothetical protein
MFTCINQAKSKSSHFWFREDERPPPSSSWKSEIDQIRINKRCFHLQKQGWTCFGWSPLSGRLLFSHVMSRDANGHCISYVIITHSVCIIVQMVSWNLENSMLVQMKLLPTVIRWWKCPCKNISITLIFGSFVFFKKKEPSHSRSQILETLTLCWWKRDITYAYRDDHCPH